MNEKKISQIKIYFVAFITLIIWLLLIWQNLHDGVPRHHLLNNADLPTISNWWGGIVLPALTWIALARLQKRILKAPHSQASVLSKRIFAGFVLSLIYGTVLSISFLNGYAEVSSVLFPSLLVIAIFIRVYREEFVLGFILSMSLTFGAVLPTIFAAVMALLSAMVYFLAQFFWVKIKKITSGKPAS